MRNLLAIFLLTLSAHGAVDVILGYNGNLTYPGSGADRVASFAAGGVSDVTNGLVAWWKMDDNAADTVVSDSVSNHTGIAPINTSLMSSPGKVGTALSFTNQAAITFASSEFATYPPTLAMWFKVRRFVPTSSAITMSLVGNDNTYWAIQLPSTNTTIRYFYYDGGLRYWTGVTALSTNVWYHLVVVSETNKSAMYINGVLEGESALTLFSHIGGTVQPFYLGGTFNRATVLDGWLDDFRMYDRPIASNEVYQIWNATK